MSWVTYQPADQEPMFDGPSIDSNLIPGHGLDIVTHEHFSSHKVYFTPYRGYDLNTVPLPDTFSLTLTLLGVLLIRGRNRWTNKRP